MNILYENRTIYTHNTYTERLNKNVRDNNRYIQLFSIYILNFNYKNTHSKTKKKKI